MAPLSRYGRVLAHAAEQLGRRVQPAVEPGCGSLGTVRCPMVAGTIDAGGAGGRRLAITAASRGASITWSRAELGAGR
jgi:hypothetical protein